MRWDLGQRSSNVEDRRGMGGGTLVAGGGIGALVIAGIVYLLGGDPSQVLQGTEPPAAQGGQLGQPGQRADDRLADFSSAVLGQTEQVWTQVFAERGMQYQKPVLVLYDGGTQTACGFGQAATGPFYCPNDHKLYLDLSFFREMQDRLGAPGDFAQAYVIAHEVGHHVQNLLGISDKVDAARRRGSPTQSNRLSVRLELQADCYAGVWANRADARNRILEAGDVDEALGAASAVGDDKLQQQSRGYVTPDSFTHGSSAQRARWFKRGLGGGRLEDCDTFGAAQL